jgi:hypothetical protein
MLQVFNLSPDVNLKTNHKDKDGFNFTTLQKLISNCLKRNVTTSVTGVSVPVVPVVQVVPVVPEHSSNTHELVVSGKKSKGGIQKAALASA